MFLLIVTVITVLIFLDGFAPIQERWHWLIFAGTCINVAKFDINDDVSLSIP